MTATVADPPAPAAPPVLPAAAADLVLARMLVPPAAPGKVAEAVGKLLFGRALSPDEFAAVRADLVSAGAVTVPKRGQLRLTDAGRGRALAFLGAADLPPGATWAAVVARHLFPKAAGLSPDAAGRLKGAPAYRALLLKRKYDLPAGAGATDRSVLEALACRELGFPDQASLAGVMRAVLNRLCDPTPDEPLPPKELVARLAKGVTGGPNPGADEVRAHLVRAWLAQQPPEPEPGGAADPPADFDLAAFAGTVAALARTLPAADRYHDNKAFIAPLWRAAQREPNFPRLDLAAFKTRLVEANRDGLLRLSRADLVQDMDPERVAESETEYLTATFHFVLVEGDRP